MGVVGHVFPWHDMFSLYTFAIVALASGFSLSCSLCPMPQPPSHQEDLHLKTWITTDYPVSEEECAT